MHQTWSLIQTGGPVDPNTKTTVSLSYLPGPFPLNKHGSPVPRQTTWSTNPPEAKQAMCRSGNWTLEKNFFCDVYVHELDAESYRALDEVHAMLGLDGLSTDITDLLGFPLIEAENLLHQRPRPSCRPFVPAHIYNTLSSNDDYPGALDPNSVMTPHYPLAGRPVWEDGDEVDFPPRRLEIRTETES